MNSLLLFLHGFMGRGDDWAEIAEHLETDSHVLAPDLPGHGSAVGLPPSAYTMDGAADALIQSLDNKGFPKAAIVGYSMGGRLALHFALRHPGRVERLVLISASPGLRTEEERIERSELDHHRAAEIEANLDGFLRRWYRLPLFESLDDQTCEALIAKRSENTPAELRKSLEGMGTGTQLPHWEHLHQIRVPAWAVAGARDAKFVQIAKQMAESAVFEAEIIPNAGHALISDQPHAIVALLRRTLSFH